MRIRLLVTACAGAALLAVVPSAPAAPLHGCAAKILREWRTDMISVNYAPSCYRTALANLPEDLMIYSSAQDDITRALRARLTALASRDTKGGRVLAAHAQKPKSRTSERVALVRSRPAVADDTLPIPVIVAAAAALLLIALASASRLSRRLHR